MVNYKSYQQVLNLSPKCLGGTTTKRAKNARKCGVPREVQKRRTRTGCLTCRRRKKKCDEDKVDGKCQACTRNFLECSWSSDSRTDSPFHSKSESKDHFDLKSTSNIIGRDDNVTAYPTPVSTPPAEESLIEESDPESPMYVHCCNNGTSSIKNEFGEERNAYYPKFVITSFDKEKALCQVSAQ